MLVWDVSKWVTSKRSISMEGKYNYLLGTDIITKDIQLHIPV